MPSWMKHPQSRTHKRSSSSPSFFFRQSLDLAARPPDLAPSDPSPPQSERSSSEVSVMDFLLESELAHELADSGEQPLPRFSSILSPDPRIPQRTVSPSDEACPSLIDDLGSPSAPSIGRTLSRDSASEPPLTTHQEPVLLKASTIQHLVGVRVVFDDEWTGFDNLDELEQPEFVKRPDRPKRKHLLDTFTGGRSGLARPPSSESSPSMDPTFARRERATPSPPSSATSAAAAAPAPFSPTKATFSSPAHSKRTPLFRLFQRPRWLTPESSPPVSPTARTQPVGRAAVEPALASSSSAATSRPGSSLSGGSLSKHPAGPSTVEDDRSTSADRPSLSRSRSAEPIEDRSS